MVAAAMLAVMAQVQPAIDEHTPESRRTSIRARLGRSGAAVLVFDSRLRVLGGNPAGLDRFCAAAGRVEQERLVFADPGDAEALSAARRRLARDGLGEVIVKFESGGTRSPEFALLIGGRLGDNDEDATPSPEAYALAFAPDPPEGALGETLTRSFGLTPAEARLAVRLKDGLTLAEAAETLGVALNTARNQLRAIFDKLGLRRQSELVRALAQLAQLSAGVDA